MTRTVLPASTSLDVIKTADHIILAETAEFLHEVDRDRAEKARSRAEAILLKGELSEEEFKEAQDDLFRAIARLEHTESK